VPLAEDAGTILRDDALMSLDHPYYRPDLARIHHLGFGFHADDCAPGILGLLEPILEREGLVVELGCGSGLLTRYLVDAGHRVIATDASPAMLEIAREYVPEAYEIRRLVLPDDPIPDADAIVAVGHVFSYLPNAAAIDRAFVASAEALRAGGLLALNICDLTYGAERADLVPRGWAHDDWALVTEVSLPSPDRFVRQMAIFSRNEDGSWRRDDERHDNILVDTSRIPALLAEHGIAAELGRSFGTEEPIAGLITVTGHRLA
jgi:SAM-dependent methyltransferase